MIDIELSRKGNTRFYNLKNLIIGRWFVLEEAYTNKNKVLYWKCRCSCGTIKNVRSGSLIRGISKSCGCLRKELHRTKRKNCRLFKGVIMGPETLIIIFAVVMIGKHLL